jgi:nucleoside-diphosphate-sugar epimerase
MSETVLVTGAFGLVGSATVRQLRADGRHVQGDIAPASAAAMGLVGGIPAGRKGNPEALKFQRVSWPHMLAELADRMGWRRYPARLAAPYAHALLKHRSPYYRSPGRYADPWRVMAAKWNDPRPDKEPA